MPHAQLTQLPQPNPGRNTWDKGVQQPSSRLGRHDTDPTMRAGDASTSMKVMNMLCSMFPVLPDRSAWRTECRFHHILWSVFPVLVYILAMYIGCVKVLALFNPQTSGLYEQFIKEELDKNNGTITAAQEKYILEGSMFIDLWISSLCVFVFVAPLVLSLSQKAFIQSIPTARLHKVEQFVRKCLVGILIALITIVVALALVGGVDEITFVALPLACMWLAAITFSMITRTFLFLKVHSTHYKILRDLADGDDVDALTSALIDAHHKMEQMCQNYLEKPLIAMVILTVLNLVTGAIVLFKLDPEASDSGINKNATYPLVFMALNLLCVAAPLLSLVVIDNRASTLHRKICINANFKSGQVSGLLNRFDLIFPHVIIQEVYVTKAKVFGLLAGGVAPLAAKLFTSL